jgi:DNA (cytosine-5)-methyltransferase 1
MKVITHGSAFTGIGMFDYAAERAGIKTIWQIEKNEFRQKVLKLRYPNAKLYKDITTVKRLKSVDIISAGFPCTDVSIANSNATDIDGENTGLWKYVVKITSHVKPIAVIFENSPELLKKGFEKFLYDFQRLGYDVWWKCLYASQFGYPHKRKRLYGICYDSHKIGWEKIQIFIEEFEKESRKQIEKKIDLGACFSGTTRIKSQCKNYTEFLRMDNGNSDNVDRLEAIGDSIVWECAFPIFKSLKKIIQL